MKFFFKPYFYLLIFLYLFAINIHSKEYILKWYNSAKVLDFIEFNDKSKYQITAADGSWEDNEGNYGFLKCLGPIKVNPAGKIELEVFCKGFDNLNEKFTIRLIRKSEYDVGIGEAIYLQGSGRYESLIKKKCRYAIKYIKEGTKGFYRHICK